ncbi:MAG: PDZ domain-containing protein, partial [Acidobacteriales bacterium]
MSIREMLRKQKLLSFTLLVFTLSFGIVIGTLLNTSVSAQKGQAAPDATPLVIPSPVQLSTAFSQLAKRLEPSVVNISTDYLPKQAPSAKNRQRNAPQTEEDDQGFDMFRRFFGQSPFEDMTPQQQQRREGTGSGVVVDANGYILTNNHVVDRADRIQVKFNGDSTLYTAKLIGTDRETDMAVIKVDAPRKLNAAKIGNSDAVQVGDWAVAIGSPFGLQATVTAGIISAKQRDLPGTQFQHFLQTDAAINPGNSGGPLLNINGEVIGINTAIATSTNGYQGVGFALPINTAVKVYNELIKTGKVTRGSIGVSLKTSVEPELLEVYGAKEGAFVSAVTSGSPADKAGLKEGDVIVSVGGKTIKNGDDLVNAVAEAPVGSQTAIGVIRAGKRMDLQVTIGNRAEIWADRLGTQRPGDSERSEGADVKFGIRVSPFTA